MKAKNSQKIKKESKKMKNSLKILAICLIMCLCVPFISCIVEEADEYAYVAIDINPSVELIIKNGKLVGALTHVLVRDPTGGYGIFIENMLSHMSE